MAERYSRLYSLSRELYTEGSPVIIAAGALLKDNATGKTLAQLKMRSISSTTIKAITVHFFAKDTAGRALGDPIVHSYLDLHISRDEEFGQKTAIPFPDDTARAFVVVIAEVVFTNGSLWTPEDAAEWKSLRGTAPLVLADDELKKQYQLEICIDASYAFSEELGLWYCNCGAVNHIGKAACHLCGTAYEKLKNVDFSLLKKHCDERLAKEEEERKAKEEAERIEAERRAEETRIAAKKRKKIIKITTPIIAACIAFVILLTTVIIPNSKYENALSKIDNGKIVEGYEELITLGGYRDSKKKAGEIRRQYLSDAIVGDTVLFGAYEQDNKMMNGKENVEWLVLAKESDRLLVISRYVLDCKFYNDTYEWISWKNCTLRDWLNNEFINDTFNAEEQSLIVSDSVSTSLDYTPDRVFLLSIDEASRYFKSDEARACAPTPYAHAKGCYTSFVNSNTEGCSWYLRSPGRGFRYSAACVYSWGPIDEYGQDVFTDEEILLYGEYVKCYGWGVRPAMWIDLNS